MEVRDFKVGDRVKHLMMDELGTVAKVDFAVTVKFDRLSSRGQPIIGIYDDEWFNAHPGWMKHPNGERDDG
jgi:hypothetical protein